MRRFKKKKETGRQEGGSAKARFRVSLTKNFIFGSRVFGFERPVSCEYRLLRDLVYEEAMCEGSSGNGLPYAAKAVPYMWTTLRRLKIPLRM